MLVKENNILLRTLIAQNNILFQHQRSSIPDDYSGHKHTGAETTLDTLYQTANQQINDKSRHIPMSRPSNK